MAFKRWQKEREIAWLKCQFGLGPLSCFYLLTKNVVFLSDHINGIYGSIAFTKKKSPKPSVFFLGCIHIFMHINATVCYMEIY